MSENIPKKISKYEIIEEIGRGNMGVVYKGYDTYIKRHVAVKVATKNRNDMQYKRLFQNEVQVSGNLDHQNIVGVYDAGEDGGLFFMVMEYVKGATTLRKYCAGINLMPVDKVMEIMYKCANALYYAHERGIIHRDIKPDNIMLTDEMDVKIADFGVALSTKCETSETQVSGLMGTPRYMSPEQIMEWELTAQSDIFSLGVIMYELLTGKMPFSGKDLTTAALKIISEDPPPINMYRQDISGYIIDIVTKALKKELQERYQSCKELAEDIGKFCSSCNVSKKEEEPSLKLETLKTIDLFKNFSDDELNEILSFASVVNYAAGAKIVGEGDIIDSLYVVLEGDVIIRKKDVSIVRLKSGGCFGEHGFLTDSASTIDIFAGTKTSLIRLSISRIEKAGVKCQLLIAKAFIKILTKRLVKTSNDYAKLYKNTPEAEDSKITGSLTTSGVYDHEKKLLDSLKKSKT
ncbi:MAG: protein kinase [Nitrospirae bacterium]|nr:protein kinase [Nitrospirota bacterium]